MTKEEKQLLLQDLSARLSYGVFVYTPLFDDEIHKVTGMRREIIEFQYRRKKFADKYEFFNPIYTEYENVLDCKPCLRPMSSMTEEECDMVEEILGDKCIFDFMANGDIVLKQGQFSQNKLAKLYDYYNSIHVDYRGLIPMGLAIEAPEGMYKTE